MLENLHFQQKQLARMLVYNEREDIERSDSTLSLCPKSIRKILINATDVWKRSRKSKTVIFT